MIYIETVVYPGEICEGVSVIPTVRYCLNQAGFLISNY